MAHPRRSAETPRTTGRGHLREGPMSPSFSQPSARGPSGSRLPRVRCSNPTTPKEPEWTAKSLAQFWQWVRGLARATSPLPSCIQTCPTCPVVAGPTLSRSCLSPSPHPSSRQLNLPRLPSPAGPSHSAGRGHGAFEGPSPRSRLNSPTQTTQTPSQTHLNLPRLPCRCWSQL
jgi:hypothetical protein